MDAKKFYANDAVILKAATELKDDQVKDILSRGFGNLVPTERVRNCQTEKLLTRPFKSFLTSKRKGSTTATRPSILCPRRPRPRPNQPIPALRVQRIQKHEPIKWLRRPGRRPGRHPRRWRRKRRRRQTTGSRSHPLLQRRAAAHPLERRSVPTALPSGPGE